MVPVDIAETMRDFGVRLGVYDTDQRMTRPIALEIMRQVLTPMISSNLCRFA